jgi:hypothetical protein
MTHRQHWLQNTEAMHRQVGTSRHTDAKCKTASDSETASDSKTARVTNQDEGTTNT